MNDYIYELYLSGDSFDNPPFAAAFTLELLGHEITRSALTVSSYKVVRRHVYTSEIEEILTGKDAVNAYRVFLGGEAI